MYATKACSYSSMLLSSDSAPNLLICIVIFLLKYGLLLRTLSLRDAISLPLGNEVPGLLNI